MSLLPLRSHPGRSLRSKFAPDSEQETSNFSLQRFLASQGMCVIEYVVRRPVMLAFDFDFRSFQQRFRDPPTERRRLIALEAAHHLVIRHQGVLRSFQAGECVSFADEGYCDMSEKGCSLFFLESTCRVAVGSECLLRSIHLVEQGAPS